MLIPREKIRFSGRNQITGGCNDRRVSKVTFKEFQLWVESKYSTFMNKNVYITLSGIILSIILVSAVFHYPVNIQNALTLQSEPGLELVPSVWRIIFEPFLGLLLYFNRAFYAVEEFVAVLYWIIALLLVYTIFHCFKIQSKSELKAFLIRQMLRIPIWVGLWFSVFVAMIFVPLPNDRIVKKSNEWVLVTTHSHTDYSHDGLISEEGLLKWHQRNGFDAFFITDHSNHKQTLDFVNSRMGKELPGEPVVFCGEEFSGSNHLSLLGLKTDFSTRNQPDSVVVGKARADGAAILVNHWFDGEHRTLEYYKNLGVDGFEIENTATDKRYNRDVYKRIRNFCEKNQLAMNGGLDFHGYGSACTLWNAFFIPGWKNMNYAQKEDALLKIVKTRDQNKLKVLLLNDRPYYEKKSLIFRPVITIITYFRTLNIAQLFSWICWILVFTPVRVRIGRVPQLFNWALPVFGFVGSLFLLTLGSAYLLRIQHVNGFTKMYSEYSKLLCISGLALLLLSSVVLYFRFFKQKVTK